MAEGHLNPYIGNKLTLPWLKRKKRPRDNSIQNTTKKNKDCGTRTPQKLG